MAIWIFLGLRKKAAGQKISRVPTASVLSLSESRSVKSILFCFVLFYFSWNFRWICLATGYGWHWGSFSRHKQHASKKCW